MKRLLLLVMVAVSLASFFTVAGASSAHAATMQSSSLLRSTLGAANGIAIHNAARNQCLDADLNTMANNGTKVQLWQCNSSTQQQWKLLYDASSDSFIIQSLHAPYRCLDADLNTIANNGTKVQLWDCNGSTQQQWNLFTLSNGNSSIESNHSPYNVLDADLNTISHNGTKVQLWQPLGGINQQWY